MGFRFLDLVLEDESVLFGLLELNILLYRPMFSFRPLVVQLGDNLVQSVSQLGLVIQSVMQLLLEAELILYHRLTVLDGLLTSHGSRLRFDPVLPYAVSLLYLVVDFLP